MSQRITSNHTPTWKVEAFNQVDDEWTTEAGPMLVEAPTPGCAIEYFLACHGMLTELNCTDSQEPLSNNETKYGYTQFPQGIESTGSLADVVSILGIKVCLPLEQRLLDEHHTWRNKWIPSLSGVVEEIQFERKHQDLKWGGPSHDDHHSMQEWVQWIRTRLLGLGYTNNDDFTARRLWVEIAALAVAAIESMDRNQRAKAIKR